MAMIGLTAGFSVIPEGTHVFQITAVDYKEDYGKMEVHMQLASGQKHTERFSLLNKAGEPNEAALNAFSFFAKAALNDFSLTEIDHEDLIGCFIRCEVTHEKVESNRNAGKMLTFIRLGQKEPAEGFDTAPVNKSTPAAKTAEKPSQASQKGFDLNSILG